MHVTQKVLLTYSDLNFSVTSKLTLETPKRPVVYWTDSCSGDLGRSEKNMV